MDPCILLLAFFVVLFSRIPQQKVQYPANRDVLKVAWFNKMTVQAPEP